VYTHSPTASTIKSRFKSLVILQSLAAFSDWIGVAVYVHAIYTGYPAILDAIGVLIMGLHAVFLVPVFMELHGVAMQRDDVTVSPWAETADEYRLKIKNL
jgi:hypothetical protein